MNGLSHSFTRNASFFNLAKILALLFFAVAFTQLSFGQGCPNLVTNGNFTLGVNSFTTSFSPGCVPLTDCQKGFYCISPTFQTKCSSWSGTSSAPSAGNFMAIDGFVSGTAPFDVWRYTPSIPVVAGKSYVFSFWAKSVHPTTGGQAFDLDMAIRPLEPSGIKNPPTIFTIPITNVWTKYSRTWICPPNTNGASLFIQQPIAKEFSDFGLDDISFSCACQAAFTATPINNCGLYQITNTSSGNQPISYQWCNGTISPSLGNVQLNCGKNDYCLTMTAADGCTSSVTQSINFTETIPPLITNCPQNSTVNTNQGQCTYTIPTPWTIAATDNCDPSPNITLTYTPPSGPNSTTVPSILPKGINKFVYQAKDKCGNVSKQCAFTITVEDNEPPKINCPQNVTVQGVSTPPPTVCKVTVNNIAPVSFSDNCPMMTVTYTITGATTASGSTNASGTMFMQGVSTVTYTITDMAGNTASCSFTVTVECVVCPNNLARNGSFNITTGALGNEQIGAGVATNWGGIWPTAQCSTGDIYNTVSPLCPGTNPTPSSQGNFASFWVHKTNPALLVWREGIMNTLNNVINKNTDCYKLSFKLACTTVPIRTPFLTVYGINTTGLATGICPFGNPLMLNSALFPGNSSLVELGTVALTSSCTNAFQNYDLTFNSSTLSALGITHIFFTRNDLSVGLAYVAVDDVCLTKTPCGVCECKTVNNATVYYTNNTQIPVPIACNNTVITIPCKKIGPNFFIHGNFPCVQAGCGQNVASWEMIRPGGQPTLTGIIPINGLFDHFDLNLPWSEFSQAGNYTLKLIRYCGEKPCTCTFNFKVDSCPCDCTKLKDDVLKGFTVKGNPFSCSRIFKPLALCSNDKLTWNITTVSGTPFTYSSTTTTGNDPNTVNFPSPGGVYNICILVIRYNPTTGAICNEYKYCKKIVVKCQALPTDPVDKYVNYCPKTAIKNGDFSDIIPGILGENASIKDWELFKNKGTGEVFINDDGGAFDDGEVTLFGGKGNFAGIYQKVDFSSDNFTIIRCEIKNLMNENTPVGTVLDVRLQESLDTNSQSQPLHKFKIEKDTIGDFKSVGFTFNGKLNTNMHYLVLCVQNESDDKLKSMITIDNIEICTSSTPISVNDEATRDKMLSLRIFPNPNSGSFTVELPVLATSGMKLRITDLAGRLVMEKATDSGLQQQQVETGNLPNGLYFLHVVTNGKTIAVEKFIKQ